MPIERIPRQGKKEEGKALLRLIGKLNPYCLFLNDFPIFTSGKY